MSMNQRPHRVVVSLTDALHKAPSSIKEILLHSNVNVLDETRVLMRMNSGAEGSRSSGDYQHMQFDAVGHEDDQHVRCELKEVLFQMFRHQRAGCLLRLTPRRAHNVKLLSRLLVSGVDKVLEQLPYHLVSINVEYYDLRKFDMLNMLPTINRSQRSKDQCSCREMLNTRDMFQWLHNEYSTLRGRGTGDDFLNVEFVLSDDDHKQHTVNLSIFEVFNCNSRLDISDFFQQLPKGRPRKSTLLTDCLKESFDCKRPIFTLVLCEMPLDMACARDTRKFLQLADSACMNKSQDQIKPADSAQSMQSLSRLSSCSSRSNESKNQANLSQDHQSKLSCWYQRIDRLYAEVKRCMEQHYNVQYQKKLPKAGKQLKDLRLLQDKSGGDAGRSTLQQSKNDEAVTSKYITTLKQYRQLEKEVEKSTFACTLTKYMSSKNCELLDAEKVLQYREIKGIQEQRRRVPVWL